MCPPDNCEATGCVGHRVIDKQPVACGVETTLADVGTTYALTYVVYNSNGQSAKVQRTIVVTSPCVGGQYLCNAACSKVGVRMRS